MSPMNKQFKNMIEDNVKQDLAKQIAKEISQNIKVTYKDPMTNTSGKKKKSAKKTSTSSFIKKVGFSSN